MMESLKKSNNIILLLVFILTGFLSAQSTISTKTVSIRDGLSSNIVRSILQDKYGYMWFGTIDGLNKYDGYQFTIYKNIPGDTTSLPDNSIYQIYEDSKGSLWISTVGGLAKYNRNSNTFTTYRYSRSSLADDEQVLFFHEDSRGKMWISTGSGIVGFDSETGKFQKYEVLHTDNSISDFANYGGTISENNTGELYIASQSYGLLKFDYDASLFVQIPLEHDFSSNPNLTIFLTAAFDKDNNLWLGYSDGLAKIDLKKRIRYDLTPFKKGPQTNSFRDNAATGLFVDRNQNIWVGTGRNGLYLFDSKKQKFELLIGPSASSYYKFYQDHSGILWLASSRGAMKYDFDRKPFENYTLSNNTDANRARHVLSFFQSLSNKSTIWLGTAHGISIFDNKKGHIVQKPALTNALSDLKNLKIVELLENRYGKLRIATALDGLFSLDIKSGLLKNFKNKIYDNSTLIDNRIRSLALDKDENLWVGTLSGLQLLRKNEKDFITIPSFSNRRYAKGLISKIKDLRQIAKPLSSIINVGDYADLSKEFVVRKNTKALIYSIGEGLSQWNMVDFGWLETGKGDSIWSSGEYSETFYESGGFKNRIKIGLLNLKAGRFKLGYKSDDSHSVQSYNVVRPQDSTYWGAQIYPLSIEEFEKMQKLLIESEARKYLTDDNIRVIYSDSKNNMWVGTVGGLSKIDSNSHIENFVKIPKNKNSISNNDIRDIKEDFLGNIWIATANGLNRFSPSKKIFSVLTEKDGLPTTNLSAIEIDNQGNLWISGLKGISKIELDKSGDKQTVVNYDVKDGLQGYEFAPKSSFKDHSGKLFFGGYDGFNAFYPGNSNKTPPYLTIRNIKISNKSIKDLDNFQLSDSTSGSKLSLSHDQNNLSFEFASIHFSRPDKNRLLYKMDGVDDDWMIGDRRYASYTNLSPGDYTFNLRGSNGDGIWNEETKIINIRISAPWYNNGLAYSIYILLFFGVLYGIRRFEMGRQQKNSKIRESQLRAEAAELKAKAAEAQAKIVQAENERKSRELEEARSLQLSMLPDELPDLPHLDIAVYMQTATEVGGDYYDFHVGLDGTLTVVIGDATGHGMKAGTMVTTAKTLFKSYASNPDILFSFQEFTRCIKEMNYGKLSMCMTMLKIKGSKMQISSAGMPPSFIFRRDTRVVEEHLFKAMPLGTMEKFPYEVKETTLKPGDTILLMSDGLAELTNDKDEIYGYKRIRNGFEDMAEKAPEEIITYLKNKGSNWVNDRDPDDDVTFVVIKVK